MTESSLQTGQIVMNRAGVILAGSGEKSVPQALKCKESLGTLKKPGFLDE
jgi:hypothetical protein